MQAERFCIRRRNLPENTNQNLLDKIKNREGFYADNSVEYDLTGLEKLVEEVLPLAPEQTPLQEIWTD